MRYIDLAVILVYLVAITWFGARFRSGQKNLRDYFLGGRTAPWWAIALSIVSAETSTLTIVGTSDRHSRRYLNSLTSLARSLGSWIDFRDNLARDERNIIVVQRADRIGHFPKVGGLGGDTRPRIDKDK